MKKVIKAIFIIFQILFAFGYALFCLVTDIFGSGVVNKVFTLLGMEDIGPLLKLAIIFLPVIFAFLAQFIYIKISNHKEKKYESKINYTYDKAKNKRKK